MLRIIDVLRAVPYPLAQLEAAGEAEDGRLEPSPVPMQDGRWFWTDFTNYQLISENEDEDGWVTKEWDDSQLGPISSGELNLVDGGPITFGFYTGASHTTGVLEVTRNTGVDNWGVFICTQPTSP